MISRSRVEPCWKEGRGGRRSSQKQKIHWYKLSENDVSLPVDNLLNWKRIHLAVQENLALFVLLCCVMISHHQGNIVTSLILFLDFFVLP